MKKFQGTECGYQNFRMKYTYDIKFSCDEDGICTMFLIPFRNDAPNPIKDKLNEVLLESMNELPESERNSPNACDLDVQLKIDYSGEKTQHYLVVNVSGASNFNKSILIEPQDEKVYDWLYDEFVSYCKNRLISLIWNKEYMLCKEYINIYENARAMEC